MNMWFTSDFHEGHANIIKYCRRPFKDVYEMHNKLVKNMNNRIKEEDTVFHIGDYCFKNSPGGKIGEGVAVKYSEWMKDYNGNWIFIKGNHDSNNAVKTHIEKIYLHFGGKKICLVHNPEHSSPYCDLNLVGHVHNQWKIKRLNEKSIMINVGIDVWNFLPVNYQEIDKLVSNFLKEENEKSKRNRTYVKNGETQEIKSESLGE